jgi:hypothetical protein
LTNGRVDPRRVQFAPEVADPGGEGAEEEEEEVSPEYERAVEESRSMYAQPRQYGESSAAGAYGKL